MRAFCDICFELFEEKSEVATTACGHVFHANCLTVWTEQSQSCPKCRKSIDSSNIIKLFFSMSHGDGKSREYLENEVNELKAIIQSKNIELLRRKMEDEKKRYNLLSIKLSVLNLEHEVKYSHIKYLQMTQATMDWCRQLKDTICNVMSLTNFIQKCWAENAIQQKDIEIRILRLEQDLEICKKRLLEYKHQSEVKEGLNKKDKMFYQSLFDQESPLELMSGNEWDRKSKKRNVPNPLENINSIGNNWRKRNNFLRSEQLSEFTKLYSYDGKCDMESTNIIEPMSGNGWDRKSKGNVPNTLENMNSIGNNWRKRNNLLRSEQLSEFTEIYSYDGKCDMESTDIIEPMPGNGWDRKSKENVPNTLENMNSIGNNWRKRNNLLGSEQLSEFTELYSYDNKCDIESTDIVEIISVCTDGPESISEDWSESWQ